MLNLFLRNKTFDVVHKKGRHRSNPFILRRGSRLELTVIFTNTCVYNIGEEQRDWNKLTGLKNKFFRPMWESVMVGWRYYKGFIQLVPYIHTRGSRDFDFEKVEVPLNTPVKIIIDVQKGYVQIGEVQYFIPTTWVVGWLINSWFGGTLSARKRTVMKFIDVSLN